MGNIVTHRVNSESSMLEQPSNSSFGISKFSSNSSTESPKSPFSFPNFSSSPTQTSSPNPISPAAGLSLILVQETNPFEEVNNTVFSSRPKINVPIFQTRETDSISENQVDEPMELVSPPPMMLGPLTVEDIIFSEEYTCVRIFGPNPKVTHIYGNYVLTSTGEAAADSHDDPGYSNLRFTDGFLKNCFVCKKILEEWSEIYFYRDMSFCSEECQLEKMLVEYDHDIN